jgi:outer membrane protein OmpA-like peptidoglycan-associated protein
VILSNCTFSCTLLPIQNTLAITAGGGLDIKVRRHFAIRIIQAEYLMTRFQDYNTGGSASQNDMRLSSGLVFRFGGNAPPPLPPPAPVTYSCSVIPQSVFPGELIAASGTALNLDPAKTAVYTWSVDGGTVTGSLNTAKIDTTNTAPGAYTLKCHLSEGDKPGENADATAPYTVKAFEPPTVSCMANPQTVISGQPSTITATGVSPQNRPLTYSYSSTAGSVSGSGTTATLSTVGAPVESVTVTCNVVDDKGQTAFAKTSVMVTVPVAAPKPVTSELCSIHFDRDPRRPSRVDNEGKACLDEIALDLQRNSNAQLAIVGNAASGEKGGKKLAAERAVNTKAYLVSEKGIDSSRIAVYTGSQDGKTVSTTLIPAGATFDGTGDTPLD